MSHDHLPPHHHIFIQVLPVVGSISFLDQLCQYYFPDAVLFHLPIQSSNSLHATSQQALIVSPIDSQGLREEDLIISSALRVKLIIKIQAYFKNQIKDDKSGEDGGASGGRQLGNGQNEGATLSYCTLECSVSQNPS